MSKIQPSPSDISARVAILSTSARSLWAKFDNDGLVDWLPLYQHMADSAAVAATLWDEFLPASIKKSWTDAFDGDPELARRVAILFAAVHDIGKASPAFTWQVESLRVMAEDAGLPFHASVKRIRSTLPHSMASYLIVRDVLIERHGFERGQATRLAAVPLGHHGTFRPPPTEYDSGSAELLGTGTAWDEVQGELVTFCESLAGLTDDDFVRLRSVPLHQTTTIVATAFTIMSDWIASNAYYFPLRSSPRPESDAVGAMRSLGLPPPWSAEDPGDDLFTEHLALESPRPLQTELVRIARTLDRPELIILEAPTGEGKTKAALGAAEILAAKFGLGGVLFALPTQATSDGIFGNIREWLDAIQGDADVSLNLAHGKSQFNPDFQDLPRFSRVFDDERGGRTVANAFLTGRSKLATTSDFVVGTIDQMLLGALRSKHVVLRHLGMAGKVVIVDEVHAADAYMRAYLCRMLIWLGAYGVPVIAMSATLPPSIRDELLTAYNEGVGRRRRRQVDTSNAYPRITSTSDAGANVTALAASGRTSSLSIEECSGTVDDIAAAVLRESQGSGTVAVVCDTVSRAQSIYSMLREGSSADVDVTLLHSRFLAPDRIAKEQALRVRLGPDADPGGRPLIVVATQVIEQSLDIDFDLMFSDIAPIDLLLQRAGRLHRHGWKDSSRPAPHRTPRLILTGFNRTDGRAPTLDRGCRAVYGASALLRSIATLDDHFSRHDVVTSPDHVADLVTTGYESITAPPGWEDAWTKADDDAIAVQAKKKQSARLFLISKPSSKPLMGWDDQSGANPDGERGVAQVRDAEDSIEVIVIQRINGRRVIPEWAPLMAESQVDFATVIEDDVARAAAMNTLRLPGYLSRPGFGDDLIDELEQNCVDTWQNSRWLRGALPLVLDADGNAEHLGHRFHYDTDLGLVVTELENL